MRRFVPPTLRKARRVGQPLLWYCLRHSKGWASPQPLLWYCLRHSKGWASPQRFWPPRACKFLISQDRGRGVPRPSQNSPRAHLLICFPVRPGFSRTKSFGRPLCERPILLSGGVLRGPLRQEELFRDGGPVLVGDLVGEVVDGDAAILRECSGRHRNQALQAAG